ncbi:MAG: ABC transporter ATP-binding protein [Bacillota bacterium]|nr:ABC transporter ATP-binding protein [Bacillota bacterium]
MLKLSNVAVNYGKFQALNGIDMEVNEGELVVLLGSNGAGKSTIFRTISGLNKPSNGEILFNDQKISGWSPDKVVREGIIHCPEGRKLFPRMTILENLILGGYVIRHKKNEVNRNIEKVLELFPILREKIHDKAGSMSGGQQQMLAIGRALMANPKVFMLDEPSLGLAPLLVEQMFEIIQQINKAGTTVLLAEQNSNAALQIADRGYVIETGKIVIKGTSQELLENTQIKEAYLGA